MNAARALRHLLAECRDNMAHDERCLGERRCTCDYPFVLEAIASCERNPALRR